MHDTDSIIYLYHPEKYNIPQGNIWGEWDCEKIDYKNGGLRTFIGLCPKSYAVKAANNQTLLKLKGVSLKYSTQPLVNFDILEEMVKTFIATGTTFDLQVPQMNFVYRIGKGIETWNHLKKVSFNPSDLKGNLSGATLYPFGWRF